MNQKISDEIQIISHEFTSLNLRCEADLYLPNSISNPPILIMAHGFGAPRNLRLPAYAEFFARHGIAVFLFDYRCFGTSEGQPRNWVSPERHIQDWQNAIAYVKGLSQVNTNKLALWGTSYSGGHVLVTASKEKGLAGVIAQVPFVDAGSSVRRFKFSFIIKGTLHAIWDKIKSFVGAKPHLIKIVGLPSEFAALNTPDAYDGVMKLVPPNFNFENFCPGRVLLELVLYKPMKEAGKIICPTMIMGSRIDTLIDIKAVKKTAEKIPQCQYFEYECGHFDIYLGNLFEDSINKQLKFLKTCFERD